MENEKWKICPQRRVDRDGIGVHNTKYPGTINSRRGHEQSKWTVAELNRPLRNANAVYYRYTNGPF